MPDESESRLRQALDEYGHHVDEFTSRVWIALFLTTIIYIQIYIADNALSADAASALQEPILFGEDVYGVLGPLIGVYVMMPYVKVAVAELVKEVRARA